MSGPTQPYEDYESVDLTEDEQSVEDYFTDEGNPFNFVNCSTGEETRTSIFTSSSPPPLSRINKNVPLGCPKQTVKYKNLPNLLNRHGSTSRPANLAPRKLAKSSQVIPRSSILAETQDIADADSSKAKETIYVEPNEQNPDDISVSQNPSVRNQIIPNDIQNQTMYSEKQPGKVVIIKKNNKFYKIVIPHNVMPNINQSTGPVLINIPEVGPLVIRNDPQVTKSNPVPVTQPFSLNLDEGQPKNSVQPIMEVRKKPVLDPKMAALCDKRFCWSFRRGRKRDLDGFAYTDRLGFTRAECQRARKCSLILGSILNKKRTEIINQMHEFNVFKESVKKQSKEKSTNVNKLSGKTSKKKLTKSKLVPDGSVSLPPLHYFPTNKVEQHSDYDCDLLVTKKVVILNSSNRDPINKKKPRRKKITRQKRKSTNKMKLKRVWARKLAQHKRIVANNTNPFMLKPCYVHMVRDDIVEEAYREYCHGVDFNCKQAKDNLRSPIRLGNKVKRNVIGDVGSKKATDSPKSVALQRYTSTGGSSKVPLLDVKILKEMVITSEARFKKVINSNKPHLIINEHNMGVVNYSVQFDKSNIIYLVPQNRYFPLNIVRNDKFISALELGYIKLVDALLFCKYLSSDSLKGTEASGLVSEHNYCMSKNKLI